MRIIVSSSVLSLVLSLGAFTLALPSFSQEPAPTEPATVETAAPEQPSYAVGTKRATTAATPVAAPAPAASPTPVMAPAKQPTVAASKPEATTSKPTAASTKLAPVADTVKPVVVATETSTPEPKYEKKSERSSRPAVAQTDREPAADTAAAVAPVTAEVNPEATTPLFATESTPKATAPQPTQRSLFWQIINTILKLTLVLIVAYVAMAALKKYQQGPRPSVKPAPASMRGNGRTIQVLETLSIGQGRTIYLLQAGQQALLVGTVGQQMSLLGDVSSDPQIRSLIAHSQQTAQAASPNFADVITRLLARQTSGGNAPTAGTAPVVSQLG